MYTLQKRHCRTVYKTIVQFHLGKFPQDTFCNPFSPHHCYISRLDMGYISFGQCDFGDIQLDKRCNCHDLELVCSVLLDSLCRKWNLDLVSAALQDSQRRMSLLQHRCKYRLDKGHNWLYPGCFGNARLNMLCTRQGLNLVCNIQQDSQCMS